MCSSVVEPHCVTIGLHFLPLYLSPHRWRYLQSQRRGVWNVGGSWSARRWRYSCGSSTGPGSDQALNKWFCFFFFQDYRLCVVSLPSISFKCTTKFWGDDYKLNNTASFMAALANLPYCVNMSNVRYLFISFRTALTEPWRIRTPYCYILPNKLMWFAVSLYW